MLEQAQNDFQSNVTPLLRGIAEDFRTLVRQEIALAKSETRQELARTRAIALSFVAAVVLALSGLVILSLMGAEALAFALPALERWQAYGIIAAVELLLALTLVFRARAHYRKLSLFPQKTAESIKRVVNG